MVLGDCIEVMGQMEENSIDAIVTDPPYGFAFMGKKWDYDIPSVECWKQALRVLKPGGHILAFGGPRTYHRLACSVEDAGFEIRDQLQWLFGQGFPKSLNLGEGRGTALKPANEPILLARKPISEKTVAKNVEKWGTGGLNIDACRIGTEIIAQHQRDLSQAHGNKWAAGTKQPVTGITNYTQGRFPSNLLLDEQAAAMLDEQSGNRPSKMGGSAPASGHWGNSGPGNAIRRDDSGGASRFFYCAKTSKSERNAGLEGMPEKPMNTYNFSEDGSFTQNATAKTGQQVREPRANHHPTVKPIKLMSYLCKLITPPNGTVLDPFMGSGSTGVAAKQLGFKFIGIEKEPEYFEIAMRRMDVMRGDILAL